MAEKWKKFVQDVILRKGSGDTDSENETGEAASGADRSPAQLNKSLSPSDKSDRPSRGSSSRPSLIKLLSKSFSPNKSPGSPSSAGQASHQSDVRSPEMQAIVDQGVERISRDTRHAQITAIPSISPRRDSANSSPMSSHDSVGSASRPSPGHPGGWEQDPTRSWFPREYSEGGRPRPRSVDPSSCDVSQRRFSLYDNRTRHMSAGATSGTKTVRKAASRRLSDVSKLVAKMVGTTDFLYVFGGNKLAHGRYTIERYDINRERWERVGVGMPHFAESYAVAVYQDLIWVIGGEAGRGRDWSSIPDVLSCEDSIEAWQYQPALNKARASLGVAELDDKLYVVGGKDGGNILDSTEYYNSAKDQWILISARLNRRRHDFGCTSYKGQIYVAGGYDGGLEPLRSVEVFSSKSRQWTVQENTLNSRRRFLELGITTAAVISTLYAAGGGNARDMEYFSGRTSSWKPILDSDEGIERPYNRDSTAIAFGHQFIYFVGGNYKDKNPLVISDRKGRFVYCYDTLGEGWFRIQDMIEGRGGAKAIVKHGCKFPSESNVCSGYRPPSSQLEKPGGSGQGNQGHGGGSSSKRSGSHGSGEATGQDQSGSTTGSDHLFSSDAKSRSPFSKSAREKDVSKIPQSIYAGSPKSTRRNLGAPASSPSGARRKVGTPTKGNKSGIQSGARPKYSSQPKNSPGVRRKLDAPTKTYQPGATAQTGWHYNDGKSPTTRRWYKQSSESGARPKTGARPTAQGSGSKPPTHIGNPAMHRNPGTSSDSHARRCLESPTTKRKPVAVHVRPRTVSSPKTRAGHDPRRRPATPPSNVFHSVGPGTKHHQRTPPYLFRPIQPTSPVRESMKQGKDDPLTSGAAHQPKNVVELGDYMYVFGGTGAGRGTMERYNFRTKKWESCDVSLPHSGIGSAITLFQGRAWIIGGGTTPGSSHREVHAFHPDEGLWKRAPALRNGRQSLGAAVLGRKLFAVGGKHNERVLHSVESFDHEGKWKEEASLNTGRYAFGIAEHGGKIYVAGGADRLGYKIKTVEIYTYGAWTLGNRSLIYCRKLFGLISTGGGTYDALYAFGGAQPEILRNGAWEALSDYDARRDRSGPAVASYGKYIYLIGGERSQNYSNVKNRLVDAYDTTTDSWSNLDSMHEARSDFFAVVFQNCRV